MPEKEKPKAKYELVEIPTEMGLAFRDNEQEKDLSQAELLTQIANDIAETKKAIVGGK